MLLAVILENLIQFLFLFLSLINKAAQKSETAQKSFFEQKFKPRTLTNTKHFQYQKS